MPNHDEKRGIFSRYYFVETKSGRDCPVIKTETGMPLHFVRYPLVVPMYLFPSSPLTEATLARNHAALQNGAA